LFKGLRVSTTDIREILETEVIKRDALEGDRAENALKSVRRATRRRVRNSEEKAIPIQAKSTPTASASGTVQAEHRSL